MCRQYGLWAQIQDYVEGKRRLWELIPSRTGCVEMSYGTRSDLNVGGTQKSVIPPPPLLQCTARSSHTYNISL